MAPKQKDNRPFHLAQYNIYANALRNWLIAFGIGAVVFLFTDNNPTSKINMDAKITIFFILLIGIFLQVLLVFLNKYAQWMSMRSFTDKKLRKKTFYNLFIKTTLIIWIDFIIDLATIVLYVTACYFILRNILLI